MRFSIRNQARNGLDTIVLTDEDTRSAAEIVPAHGAFLNDFTRQENGQSFSFVDGHDSLEAWQRDAAWYKSAKLSPFVCRLRDARYAFGGHAHEFQKKFGDGNAIHGLLFDKPFTDIGHQLHDEFCSAFFLYRYDKDDPGYPFTYECRIGYTLHADGRFIVQTIVTNESPVIIPIADGWHPYFRLGGSADDWTLQFPAATLVGFDEKLIPTGKQSPFSDFNRARPIGDRRLDNCFVLQEDYGHVSCRIADPASGRSVTVCADKTYPYLQLYIPDARKSIAIENLSAEPDAFNNGEGLILLEPNTSQTFTVQYEFGIGDSR